MKISTGLVQYDPLIFDDDEKMKKMIDVANKRISIYVQIKETLIQCIKSGEMAPMSKLPSERELAGMYSISRGTAKQALQELESEGYIERIPAKGSFVKSLTDGKLKKTNIIFPFPEESISMNCLMYANWATAAEIYRGMMASCSRHNTRVTFQHFEDTGEQGIIQKQVKEVMEFDGAIFLGWQLSPLKKELAKLGIPFVTVSPGEQINWVGPIINYNRTEIIIKSAEYLVDCGYRNIGYLSHESDHESKANILRKALKAAGAELNEQWNLKLNANEDLAYEELKNRLPNDINLLPDAFFCGSQIFPFVFQRIADERNWKIPDDIGLFGYANNLELRPFRPKLTHVHIPYDEMGLEACRMLSDGYLAEATVKATIIDGETTRKGR